MAKVNVCLKRSFLIVISLIAILCALMLALTLFTHGHLYNNEEMDKLLPGLQILYSLTILTLILAIIAMYGACKEKKWALIMFAVGMIIGTLFWIVNDIQGLAQRPKVVEQLTMHFRPVLSWNDTSEINENLKNVQINFQCCGLDHGYLDWGYNIPESCLCTENPTNPCVAAPRNSSLFEHNIDDQPIMIYKESCLPYTIAHIMMIMDATLGIILGIILLWTLSVVLCILILCRLSKKDDVPVVVYSSEAKAGNYTALEDTAEHI
ncbi:tetraspanin-8-like [Clinocottus analis]|uniref:tetraspanin-8-like n=1 Tax=Clinocottus analis TaxID=304258 RepID=UPI0035C1C4B5